MLFRKKEKLPMDIFKTSKYQPMKLRGFTFIGGHSDYSNCAYYYKHIGKGNYELMELMLEGAKKPEIGAGTKVQILDTFMTSYLHNRVNKIEVKDTKDFVHKTISKVFNEIEGKAKTDMVKKFSSAVPTEIKNKDAYKKALEKGYELLYCSNDESKERRMGIVNIVLVKHEHIKSADERIEIDREYTLFKPLKYMTTPSYVLGKSKVKYFEEELPQIVVNHDLLK